MFSSSHAYTEESHLELETKYIKEKCHSIEHRLFNGQPFKEFGREAASIKSTSPDNIISVQYWHRGKVVFGEVYKKHFWWYMKPKGYICTVTYDNAYNFVSKEVTFISQEAFINECKKKFKNEPIKAKTCLPPIEPPNKAMHQEESSK